MADLPELEEIQENVRVGDEYEHPEPDTPVDGCSNMGEAPLDILQMADPEGEEDGDE